MIAGCAASMLFPAATTDGDIFLADCQMYGSAITVYWTTRQWSLA